MVSAEIFDPGGWSNDNFGALYAEVTRDKILLTDAKSWNKKRTPSLTTKKIKDDINAISKAFNFKVHLCETNNQGHMIISDLRNAPYKIPVMGVNTSANLKKQGTISRGNTLDKNKVVPYLQKFIEEGIIEWPKILTPGLRDMKIEIENFGVTKAGKYQALSGTDDFISCLVILVHWAMRKMLRAIHKKLVGAGAKEDPYHANKTDTDRVVRKLIDRYSKYSNKIDIKVKEAKPSTW